MFTIVIVFVLYSLAGICTVGLTIIVFDKIFMSGDPEYEILLVIGGVTGLYGLARTIIGGNIEFFFRKKAASAVTFGAVTLGNIVGRFSRIEVGCNKCDRRGSYSMRRQCQSNLC